MLEISVLPSNCIANLPHCIICSNACFFQSSAMFSICLPNIFADKGMHFSLTSIFFLYIRAAIFTVTWRAGVFCNDMRLLVFLYWIVATQKRLPNIHCTWNSILWSTGLSITSWNIAEKKSEVCLHVLDASFLSIMVLTIAWYHHELTSQCTSYAPDEV